MTLRHLLIQVFVALLLFSADVQAGPTGAFVSVPLERAKREPSQLPSVVVRVTVFLLLVCEAEKERQSSSFTNSMQIEGFVDWLA